MSNRLLTLARPQLDRVSPKPSGVEASIKAFAAITTQMNGANMLLMRRLVAATAKEDFQFVFYKGPLLQHMAHGNLFTRPSSDIDVLVSPAHYDAAARTLTALGYHRDPSTATIWWRRFLAEQQFRAGSASLAIDLHHRVQQPGCPLPRHPERFLDESVSYVVAGQPVNTFSMRHTVLVAAMSLVKALHHREATGRYVADVHALASKLSPAEQAALWEEARLQGLNRTLTLALRSANAVFGDATHAVEPILQDVSDAGLRQMLLDPDRVTHWVRRRRLLRTLCDRPTDIVACWLLMAAAEAARVLSPTPAHPTGAVAAQPG